jgi:predicted nucleotidyltransferase/DNA-binding XRE family transcriptional regulator
MRVGPLIVSARTRAGLTQAQLASKSGTSQATLSRYESGSAIPTIATLERIIAATGAALALSVTDSRSTSHARSPRLTALRRHRSRILEILTHHHASNPLVFGSVVRGEDRPDSDIDILIDLDTHKHGLLPVIHIRDELENLLGEKVDIAPRDVVKKRVLEHALREAVPL